MKIQQLVQEKIDKLASGRLITYKNIFRLYEDNPSAVAKGMERLVRKGALVRQKPGVFYKPEQGRFGLLPVKETEILRRFMYENGRIIGYLSGPDAFRALGISTQVPGTVTIATFKKRRRIRFNDFTIRFIQSRIKTIKKNDIPKLQLLDALRQIKKAQDVDINDALDKISRILTGYSAEQKERVFLLGKKYNPQTKALLGAILQKTGRNDLAMKLKKDLNPLTSYNIGVSTHVLPNKGEWAIL